MQAGGFAYAIAGANCKGFNVLADAIAMAPPALLDVAFGDFSFMCAAQYAYRENDWPNLSGNGQVGIAVVDASALAVFDLYQQGPNFQVGYGLYLHAIVPSTRYRTATCTHTRTHTRTPTTPTVQSTPWHACWVAYALWPVDTSATYCCWLCQVHVVVGGDGPV